MKQSVGSNIRNRVRKKGRKGRNDKWKKNGLQSNVQIKVRHLNFVLTLVRWMTKFRKRNT